MRRITYKNCERLAETFNRETGSPTAAYVQDASGQYRAQIGNYHVYRCLGVCSLHRMANESGGVTVAIAASTAPELYEKMHAWLDGHRAAKESKA